MMTIEEMQTCLPNISTKKNDNEWVIMESEAQATFKQLTICKDGASFVVFNHDITNAFNLTSEILDYDFKDYNTDGVAIMKCEQHDGIIITELKSTCNQKNMTKAYQQMLVGLLKLYEQVKHCEKFCIGDYTIDMIMGCHKINDNTKAKTLMKIQTLRTLGRTETPFDRLLTKYILSLIEYGKIKSKVSSLPYLEKSILDDTFSKHNVCVRICMAKDEMSEYSEIEL